MPAPLLMLAGMVSVQFGAALAAGLVRQLGAVVVTGLRIDFAALILLAIARPRWRGRSRDDWLAAVLLGLSLAAMHLTFYGALARLPLGVVVTVEFIGPLGLAAAVSRQPRDFVAVLLALLGVVAVSGLLDADFTRLDALGLGLAAAAGMCWVGYILAGRTVGRRWRQVDGLAVAMTVAAVVITPAALADAFGRDIRPEHLSLAFGVAVMSSAIPYSLEIIALRRIDTRVFGILLSLHPAVAALAGLIVLGEALRPVEIGGIVLVVVASGMVLVSQRRAGPTPVANAAEISEIA